MTKQGVYRDPEKRKAYLREYDRRPERVAKRRKYQEERRRQKVPLRELIDDLDNGNGGMTIDRAGVLRQRFRVPKQTHHLLTERQRTVLKGKVRMSRAWVRMERIMKDTGMTMQEFVAQLSVEELVRGRLRDSAGGFRGRPPKWVPREFQQACLRELMARGQELWLNNYTEAIKAMTDIAAGRGPVGSVATPGERIKAAQFVVERIEGKVPERLVVSQEQPWQVALDGIVADVPDEAIERGRATLAATQTVEGEVVDVEYEEEIPDPSPVRSRRRRRS
jgi:hypothetical protein